MNILKINKRFVQEAFSVVKVMAVFCAFIITEANAQSNNPIPVVNASNATLNVRNFNKTMSDGANVNFWTFCNGAMGMGGGCNTLVGPTLEIAPNVQTNVTLNMMMAPQELNPYQGHTIHWHGLDVAQSEDGVPETGAAVNGDTYNFNVDNRYIGSHMYHCHVHTVKHLEMGMYGAFIVKDGKKINSSGVLYDLEWNLMYSSVDPTYHTATGDSTVFAGYNAKYFLANGKEGKTMAAASEIYTASPGKKMAIRVMGIHSVNGVFSIVNASGAAQSFTIYNSDGFALPVPKTVTSMRIDPGQTADLMITLPATTGTFYTKMEYKDLRKNLNITNGVLYSRLNF